MYNVQVSWFLRLVFHHLFHPSCILFPFFLYPSLRLDPIGWWSCCVHSHIFCFVLLFILPENPAFFHFCLLKSHSTFKAWVNYHLLKHIPGSPSDRKFLLKKNLFIIFSLKIFFFTATSVAFRSSWPGVKSELHLRPVLDPSHICSLCCMLQQCWILNLLNVGSITHCTTMGTPPFFFCLVRELFVCSL